MTTFSAHGIRFDADLTRATTAAGKALRFSKRERSLLRYFIDHPQVLVTRDTLMTVIADQNIEMLDRNIDFLISRLRRKLGDSSRNPHFIATQYGEGYVWVAATTPAPSTDHAEEVFIMIGPVLGLRKGGTLTASVLNHVQELKAHLLELFGSSVKIGYYLDSSEAASLARCHYSLELSFLHPQGRTLCSAILRDGHSDYIHNTWRQVHTSSASVAVALSQLRQFAEEIHTSILEAALYKPTSSDLPEEMPLAVAMEQAGRLFANSPTTNDSAACFLRQKLAQNPNDHRSAILLAVNIHLTLVNQNLDDIENRMSELETLLIRHLPGVQDDALYLSATAKLLFFVGHRQLAEELAETAMELGPSYAATLMVLAQVKMFRGELDYALEYYDLALQRCAADSQFRSLVLLLKAIALKAAGEQAPIAALLADAITISDSIRPEFILFLQPNNERLDPAVTQLTAGYSLAKWQEILKHCYYINMRLFESEQHRERVISDLLKTAVAQVGPGCLIDELREAVPSLYLSLQSTDGRLSAAQ